MSVAQASYWMRTETASSNTCRNPAMSEKEAANGGGLGVSRIIRSAFGALDQDPVDLVLVGMEQDGGATTAGIIHRVFARP